MPTTSFAKAQNFRTHQLIILTDTLLVSVHSQISLHIVFDSINTFSRTFKDNSFVLTSLKSKEWSPIVLFD